MRRFAITKNDKEKLKFLLANQGKPFAPLLAEKYNYSRQAALGQLRRFVQHGLMINPALGDYQFNDGLLPAIKKIADSLK